jgi:two-component system chemotaxis response regulator CheY
VNIQKQAGKMVHVVIVEDEEIMRGLVEQIVAMLGWTYESAVNGTLGLQIIERVAPDLVITDVGMPGMNGIDLLKAIKENPRLSHIPVVITSSIDREAEARAAGYAAYLTKPFTSQTLLQLLPQVVPQKDSE